MDELWGEGHPYPSPYAFDLPPVFPILPPTFLPSSHILFCSLSGEEDLLISLFRTKDIRILTGPYFKVGLLFQNPWEDSFVHLLPGANTSWACFLQFSSVTQSCLTPLQLQPHESQHARPPCPSPTPGVHSNLHPSSRWCHPAILSSIIPFSSCPQSLPASESFPMCQPFAWGGQSTGVSALASFLAKNTQGWFPLEWTGWISLQSKGLLRVFSNTTVQKHQFFGAQLSSQSNSYIHTWPLEKPQPCFLKLASLKQPNHSLLSPHLAGSVRDLGKSISRRGSPLVLNLLEREVLRGLTFILPISLHQTVLPYPAAYPDNFRSFSVSFPSI